MQNKKIYSQCILILCCTFVFTIIIFFIKNYYFSYEFPQEYIEEHYIEPTVQQTIGQSHTLSGSEVSSLISEHYRSASSVIFHYIPEYFEQYTKDFGTVFSKILFSEILGPMIHNLHVEMHQDIFDTRGKMKHRSVKLFGYQEEKKGEYLSVGIHELGHFIDIYFLEKKVFQDMSTRFYDISWRETKILKPGQTQKDFVSGYAMTNKYEDFAESFTYFILHNKDFFSKTLSSEPLAQKYDFFEKVLFQQSFRGTDFSTNEDIKDYYWDITKIQVDTEKLLHFFEK